MELGTLILLMTMRAAIGVLLLATLVYSMVDNGGLYEHSAVDSKAAIGEGIFGVPKYLLWSNVDGTNNAILKGGAVKTVDTYWAGLSAWNDANAVASAIKTTIDTGKIPYIQAYSFGDKGLRTNCGPAIAFDTKIAQAIGKSLAFVNIETEWDTADVIAFIKTPAGKKCMTDRIATWKKFAPKAVVTSSAGLWSPDADYTFFKDIASKLDVRSNIQHVVSDAVDCTWRVNGAKPFTGKTFDQALQVAEEITSKQDKMTRVWKSNGPFFTADLAITACGWTSSGQARVIGKLVDNMCTLVKARGWRGMNLRNYSPAPEWRAMGNNNEGMFPWSSNVEAKAQIRRGLDLAIKIMRDMHSACAGVTSAPVTSSKAPVITVSRLAASNEYWIQINITPVDTIKSVTASWNGNTVTLKKSTWSANEYVGETNGKSIPKGTQVKVTVSQTVGADAVHSLNW